MSTGSSDTLERVSTRLHAVQTSARAQRRRMKRKTDGVRSSMVWLNQGCGDGPQLAKSLGRCQVCGGVDSLPVSATRRDAAHLITAARRKETRSSDGSGGERPVCTRPRETSRAVLTHKDTYKKKKKKKKKYRAKRRAGNHVHSRFNGHGSETSRDPMQDPRQDAGVTACPMTRTQGRTTTHHPPPA